MYLVRIKETSFNFLYNINVYVYVGLILYNNIYDDVCAKVSCLSFTKAISSRAVDVKTFDNGTCNTWSV